FLEMRHVANGHGWTRTYEPDLFTNRLGRTWEGSNQLAAISYHHDPHGNMLNLLNVLQSDYIRCDYRDMIASLNLGGRGTAYYNYDAGKRRRRKVIENTNGELKWERWDLGGFERYRRYVAGVVVEEIETHHVIDGDQRILIVEDVIDTDNPRLGKGL